MKLFYINYKGNLRQSTHKRFMQVFSSVPIQPLLNDGKLISLDFSANVLIAKTFVWKNPFHSPFFLPRVTAHVQK